MKSSVLGTLRKITFKRTQSHSLIALSIILFVFEMDCDILFLIYKDTFNKLGYKAKINTHTTSYIN